MIISVLIACYNLNREIIQISLETSNDCERRILFKYNQSQFQLHDKLCKVIIENNEFKNSLHNTLNVFTNDKFHPSILSYVTSNFNLPLDKSVHTKSSIALHWETNNLLMTIHTSKSKVNRKYILKRIL